jgi:hypothetical protein
MLSLKNIQNLIIVCFAIIFVYLLHKKKYKEHLTSKPHIWCYWETIEGRHKPAYIDLCYDSIVHNCKNCFEIHRLDEKSIRKYLPELNPADLDHLSIPHKADYYRYALLEKYGGIWIDADIIVSKCLCPLYKKLMESSHDYMGFGCGRSRQSCSDNPDGKNNPTNWLMMSKPNTKFMKCVRQSAEEVIFQKKDFKYHEIGKHALEKCISHMNQNEDWDYIHIPSSCNEYDSSGHKLNNIMKPYNVRDCSSKRYFFPLYNTAPGYPDWFKNLSKDDLLNERGPQKYYLKEIIDEAFSKKREC